MKQIVHDYDYAHFAEVIIEDGDTLSNKFSDDAPVNPVIQSVGIKSPEYTIPILRKDFPETWIWNEINEEG